MTLEEYTNRVIASLDQDVRDEEVRNFVKTTFHLSDGTKTQEPANTQEENKFFADLEELINTTRRKGVVK